jgi:Uma2 family endonuclease
MSTMSSPTPGAAFSSMPSMYRLTIEQYEAMAEAEILAERDQVELVDGLLVKKTTKNPAHSVAARAVAEALARLIPEGYFVTREDPIRIGPTSEPEPDAAVVRGRSRDYARRHPDGAKTALVVEVSDSSLHLDRTEKLRVYAAGGIPVYWIINLVDARLKVRSRPEAGAYQDVRSLGSAETVAVVIDGREIGAIGVADLLP